MTCTTMDRPVETKTSRTARYTEWHRGETGLHFLRRTLDVVDGAFNADPQSKRLHRIELKSSVTDRGRNRQRSFQPGGPDQADLWALTHEPRLVTPEPFEGQRGLSTAACGRKGAVPGRGGDLTASAGFLSLDG